AVVADADRPGLALFQGLGEGLPRLGPGLAVRRPVHEPQVDEVDAQGLEAVVDGLPFPARVPRRELSGDEDVLTADAAVADGGRDAVLVPVRGGRVDVPVADLQRRPRPVVSVVARKLPRAEADQGDGHAVGELYGLLAGTCCHAVISIVWVPGAYHRMSRP